MRFELTEQQKLVLGPMVPSPVPSLRVVARNPLLDYGDKMMDLAGRPEIKEIYPQLAETIKRDTRHAAEARFLAEVTMGDFRKRVEAEKDFAQVLNSHGIPVFHPDSVARYKAAVVRSVKKGQRWKLKTWISGGVSVDWHYCELERYGYLPDWRNSNQIPVPPEVLVLASRIKTLLPKAQFLVTECTVSYHAPIVARYSPFLTVDYGEHFGRIKELGGPWDCSRITREVAVWRVDPSEVIRT